MTKKMLLFIMLSFSLVGGSVWALQAQDPPPQKPSSVRTDPPVVAATTVQTDLSGTYAGTFNCEIAGLTGDTTLTITGNEFTTSDGKTGRIVASTTGGYTAVALQVGGTDPAVAPTVISLRGRKNGNRLTLTSIGGAATKCTFVPSRNVARNRRNQRTPAATGTEVSNPAAMPSAVPTESPMPSQTPVPSPSPTPNPSPTPSGSPTPMPSPSPGEPTPNPSPGEPTPSPSPSPSPSPRPIRG
jgi:hypothetical protein